MGSLLNYAKKELDMLLTGEDDDDMQIAMNDHILEIVKVFSEFGHTGFTAGYALNIIDRLLRYKPLKPLTGEDDEWNECGTNIWQNKRCSSVFKDKNGVAVDNDEFIVSYNGGYTWFSSNIIPNTPITFPYDPPERPKRIYIEYITDDKFDIITNDPERIKKLYEQSLIKYSKKRLQNLHAL